MSRRRMRQEGRAGKGPSDPKAGLDLLVRLARLTGPSCLLRVRRRFVRLRRCYHRREAVPAAAAAVGLALDGKEASRPEVGETGHGDEDRERVEKVHPDL